MLLVRQSGVPGACVAAAAFTDREDMGLVSVDRAQGILSPAHSVVDVVEVGLGRLRPLLLIPLLSMAVLFAVSRAAVLLI